MSLVRAFVEQYHLQPNMHLCAGSPVQESAGRGVSRRGERVCVEYAGSERVGVD